MDFYAWRCGFVARQRISFSIRCKNRQQIVRNEIFSTNAAIFIMKTLVPVVFLAGLRARFGGFSVFAGEWKMPPFAEVRGGISEIMNREL